jgi:hypothetical protein
MEHQLSLPLSLLHDHHDGFDNKRSSKSLPQRQDDVDDDVYITPSTRRRYRRISHEYAEIDTAAAGNVDNGHKIVVGFLVPALLIVQWGVEWHNDEDFANLTEQALAACSLLSILFFMVLAPCFIETTSATANTTTTNTMQKQKTSLTPIVLLCLADVLVVLRTDLGALAIMVLGNVYMAWVVTAAWRDKKKNNNGNLRTDDSSDSLTEGLLLLSSSSTTSCGSVEEQRGAYETAV